MLCLSGFELYSRWVPLMCFKLAYCAFSSSPSKDSTMSTFWGFSSLFAEV